MKLFKTLDDVLKNNYMTITRDEFDDLIESDFVDWCGVATYEVFNPLKRGCTTYDIRVVLDNEDYAWLTVQVKE